MELITYEISLTLHGFMKYEKYTMDTRNAIKIKKSSNNWIFYLPPERLVYDLRIIEYRLEGKYHFYGIKYSQIIVLIKYSIYHPIYERS